MATGESLKVGDQSATFPCASCGGQMRFDVDSQSLKCGYCGSEAVIDADAEQEPVEYELDFGDEADAHLTDWGMEQQLIKCTNCSGEMLLPASQTAAVCAFCGSPKVLPQGEPDSIRPESVIPFQIKKDVAEDAFNVWRKKRWFIPGAFKKASLSSTLSGVYVPYWTFDSDTYSTYRVEIGTHHYRSETRTRTVNGKTETYTEQVRYTVWHWSSGDYSKAFDDVLIPASGQYDSKLLRKMNDFQLRDLLPYKPEYLSGFIAERYTVSLKEGWEQADEAMASQLQSEIRGQIHGDEVRNLNVDTTYSNRTYKHILLPVWNANYMYKGKSYRYMVNGESGEVIGRVPRSPWKITLFVLFCVAVVVGIVILVMNGSSA
ncbi:hypothetical protein [Paenibacillus sp. OV219]|uniref:hypothetical protein n=1 Tax=Paenibacillus sp. OV219 TaxID=1884377 RepID=UPI0008C10540|nr:hypothetical protein [Paenibacillus sp. OV219]SEN54901.1 hypothetical protein SAMN05518847_103181 [Paenibacillus sp. OV219]